MRNKIYHTGRTVIKRKEKYTTSLVWTVWYILFFISWQFEQCGIFSFSFYNIFERCGTVRTVIKWKSKYTTRLNCYLMKNKIYHTVRTVIKWKAKYTTPLEMFLFERCGIFCFSLYDSSNGSVYLVFHFITVRMVWYILFSFYNISNGVVYFAFHFMTVRTVVRTVIKGKTKYTTPFELSSNEKQNIPHRSNCHQMKNKIYHTVRTVIKWKTKSVRTVWYILFFILKHFERCGIFCFSFHDSSNVVVYLVMKNKIYHTVRTGIKWKTKYTAPFELP
jgi:hypothetical protein